jgi:hypothetical protein
VIEAKASSATRRADDSFMKGAPWNYCGLLLRGGSIRTLQSVASMARLGHLPPQLQR